MKIETIETSRLLLRGFSKEDAMWAYRIWNDPQVGQYLPDEAKEGIDYEYLKQLEVLGEGEKVYDIAYCVHKKFWGNGYATEIAQGLIGYARRKGAEKVTIYVNQENIASNCVARKCGGKIVSESTYKKRGTDQIMKDYKYEVTLS